MADDNNDRLLDIVAEQRRVLADPTGPYAARPDLKEAAEIRMAALLLRAGVQPKVETPESLAQQQHDERFQFRELHPNQVELIDQRVAEVEKGDVKRQAAELRQQVGADEYDAMVSEAKRVRPELGGAAADLTVLRLLAQNGRYRSAYEAGKPR